MEFLPQVFLRQEVPDKLTNGEPPFSPEWYAGAKERLFTISLHPCASGNGCATWRLRDFKVFEMIHDITGRNWCSLGRACRRVLSPKSYVQISDWRKRKRMSYSRLLVHDSSCDSRYGRTWRCGKKGLTSQADAAVAGCRPDLSCLPCYLACQCQLKAALLTVARVGFFHLSAKAV